MDLPYIYEILHCNHFMILSDATAYETTAITCSGIAENDEVVAVDDFIACIKDRWLKYNQAKHIWGFCF